MRLTVRKREGCRWDVVSLGEVMLRFDPGEYRIWTTRQFAVSEGGGEYNVARGLKRCFGLDAAIVTAFAKNPVGALLQDLIYQGGVDSSLIKWVNYDGVGRMVRNGLNFTERGFGVRAALGYEVPGTDENISALDPENFKKMIAKAVQDFPFKVVATTLRKATTATRNDWGAIGYSDGNFYEARNRENLEILDRVGGGDSFASGLIYGFLAGKDAQWAVECGAAHGALAMTTPGDTTMATLEEVLQVMKGAGARIAR